ncbi:hypothetical protein C5167_002767 [Papaver somniferum]|uniref:Uncharacterized protein n=1 Tax=Papaver somniferum TaxID=3469 RepID=A0A4Y7KXH1_PAPSO|nr:hypothetical protein C5167_002767 [Papaver somniferum]
MEYQFNLFNTAGQMQPTKGGLLSQTGKLQVLAISGRRKVKCCHSLSDKEMGRGSNYIYNNTFIKGVKYMGEEIQSFKATGCLADG